MHLKMSRPWLEIQDATFMVRLIHTIKGYIKKGLQDTSKGEISLKIKAKVGDPILGITSTKIKVVHLFGLPIKGLIYMRGPPSWRIL